MAASCSVSCWCLGTGMPEMKCSRHASSELGAAAPVPPQSPYSTGSWHFLRSRELDLQPRQPSCAGAEPGSQPVLGRHLCVHPEQRGRAQARVSCSGEGEGVLPSSCARRRADTRGWESAGYRSRKHIANDSAASPNNWSQ